MNNREIPLDLLPDKNSAAYIDLATLGMLFIHYNMNILIDILIESGLKDGLLKIDENGKVDHVGCKELL